jgi:sugar (glycoside-pentoside-hexuronide) transporter
VACAGTRIDLETIADIKECQNAGFALVANSGALTRHRGQILRYTVGDLGINLNLQLIGFYLAYFYTDVFGLSPAHVAGLFLVARIWDAVNDPLMGYIADHNQTRRGKFRLFLLYGALPLNLVLLACFFTPELSDTAKIVYAYVTYILHGMLFTLVGLPCSALTAVMTQDQQERAVISTYRMFFAVAVAVTLVAVGVRPFVARFSTEQQGFAVTAGIFAMLSTGLIWFAYRNTEERVEVPQEHYSVRSIIPMLARNDALLILGLAMLMNTCVWVVKNAVATYYFKYLWDDASGGLQSIFFLVMQGAAVAGALAAPYLTRRFGKLRVFMVASLVVAIFCGMRQFVPLGFLLPLFAISLVGDFAQMLCSITQWNRDALQSRARRLLHSLSPDSCPLPDRCFPFRPHYRRAGRALHQVQARLTVLWA